VHSHNTGSKGNQKTGSSNSGSNVNTHANMGGNVYTGKNSREPQSEILTFCFVLLLIIRYCGLRERRQEPVTFRRLNSV
jgi:hypothetical protein